MTATATTSAPATPAVEQCEILARIDRGGLSIPEAELRYKLRWRDEAQGSLLDVLADMKGRGLIESALHFRLSEQGRAQLPDEYEPPRRYGTPMAWRVER